VIAVERLDEIAARRERLDWPKTDDVRTLVAALRVVLAAHRPVPDRAHTVSDGSAMVCDTCGGLAPCFTVRTIAAALDVTS